MAYRQFAESDDSLSVEDTPRYLPNKRAKMALWACVGTLLFGSAIALIVGAMISGRYREPDTSNQDPYASYFEWNQTRLPDFVAPSHYKLQIEPDLINFNFTVKEEITIQINQKISTLALHCVGLKVDKAQIRSSTSGNTEAASKINYNEDLEYVYLYFDSLTKWFDEGEQSYILSIEVRGVLGEEMRGFYRSKYIENGQTQWLATTDFEPINARRAFVCFDEPAMKSNFTISIGIDSNDDKWVAISNMPVDNISHNIILNIKYFHFKTSVRMSTYLVCFIICKFDHIIDDTSLPVTVRVWTTPNTIKQAEYALSVAVSSLINYQSYFGIDYPLPKLDLIAIPDYPAGAMENWGLITFRETALLYDKDSSSESDKQRVASVICHEIAHQWFGNLVTMNWWTDLWLNEGFATFMEYVGVNYIEPSWNMWDQFFVMDKQDALLLDSLSSTHPVTPNVLDPNEIAQQFDAISYSKGGSLIRMLESYLNRKDKSYFTNGLNLYLTEHAYGNAMTSDLWRALEIVSNDNTLKDMMDSWTLYPGYPVIDIKISSDDNHIEISQSRFILSKHINNDTNDNNNKLWVIPIQFRTESGRTFEYTLKDRFGSVGYNSNDGFLLANVDGTGFYRTRYSIDLFDKLVKSVSSNSSILSVGERATIMSDVFSLVDEGSSPISEALEFSKILKNENDYAVWGIALSSLNKVNGLVELEPFYGKYKKFVLSLLDNIVNRIGWPSSDSGNGDDHVTLLMRDTILRNAGYYGNQNVIDKSKQLFQSFISNQEDNDIPASIRSSVYSNVVQYGGEDEYNWMVKRYQDTNVAAEKMRCLDAMGSSREPYLLKMTLSLSLNSSFVRPQDTPRVLSRVGSNIFGRDLTWNFFKDNFEEFQKRYGVNTFLLGNIISSITRHFSTKSQLDDVEEFLRKNDFGSSSRSVEQSLESIYGNIEWLHRNRNTMHSWLYLNSQ